jgi:hypothetical protein
LAASARVIFRQLLSPKPSASATVIFFEPHHDGRFEAAAEPVEVPPELPPELEPEPELELALEPPDEPQAAAARARLRTAALAWISLIGRDIPSLPCDTC